MRLSLPRKRHRAVQVDIPLAVRMFTSKISSAASGPSAGSSELVNAPECVSIASRAAVPRAIPISVAAGRLEDQTTRDRRPDIDRP